MLVGWNICSNWFFIKILIYLSFNIGDRYIDWLITVPLQMIEFYLILVAVRKANSGIFWRLLIGSLVMLIGGYLGEAGYINATLGFIIGMAGWVYIL